MWKWTDARELNASCEADLHTGAYWKCTWDAFDELHAYKEPAWPQAASYPERSELMLRSAREDQSADGTWRRALLVDAA